MAVQSPLLVQRYGHCHVLETDFLVFMPFPPHVLSALFSCLTGIPLVALLEKGTSSFAIILQRIMNNHNLAID